MFKKIITLYLYYQSVERILKSYFLMKCLNFLLKINSFYIIKPGGFKPGDSCINQLLVITHEIYKSFDDGFKVRGVFLDISKA